MKSLRVDDCGSHKNLEMVQRKVLHNERRKPDEAQTDSLMPTKKDELGLEVNFEAAFTCYQKAAEVGDARAQLCLGVAGETGDLHPAIDLEAARTF